MQRLSDQGITHWTDTRSLGPRIVVRIPELLAHHISLSWTNDLRKATSDEDAVEKLNLVLRLSHFVPYGDLCVAAAIARIGSGRRVYVISDALSEHTPQESRLQEGAIIELLTTDKRRIRLCLGEGMDERLPGDMLPWLVLSHLAVVPADSGDDGSSVNMRIINRIGNSEDLIYNPPPGKFNDTIALHFHDVPGVGSLPCPNAGIIEPLLQAMYFHAMWRPEEFEQLVECALKEHKIFLAWRLRTVARIVKSATNPRVREAASRADIVLAEWWRNTLGGAISH